jgi:hypothetical protein
MSDGHGQESHWESLLHRKGRSFAFPEEAVDLAQAFLADGQNIQNLVRLRERVPAQQFLMMEGSDQTDLRQGYAWERYKVVLD